MALQITGSIKPAIFTYQALFGMAPSYALLNNVYVPQASADARAFSNELGTQFSAQSTTTFVTNVLANLGVTSTYSGFAAGGYTGLLGALVEYFDAAGAANRGFVALQLATLLSGKEGDATYGAAAAVFNAQADANFGYASDAAHTSPAVVSVETGSSFTLTNDIDTATANVFTSTPVYTPGGDKFINSLQDEDTLTGTGTNPTLNLTLGTANDGAETLITPTLNGVETINVRVSGASGALEGATIDGLNLQDATGLQAINVTRITGDAASNNTVRFIELQDTVTNLSLSNSTNLGTVLFEHKEEVLTGTDEALNVILTSVRNNGVTFQENGDGVADTGFYFETINVAANGTNDLDELTFAANGREDVVAGDVEDTTKQVLNVVAGAAAGATGYLEVNTLNITGVDTFNLVANHRVDIAQDKEDPLSEDDGINSADLEALNITGAANVRIDGLEGQVGEFLDAQGLTVDGSEMTGNLRLGIVGGTSADDLLSVESGSGDDEIQAFGNLGGDVVTNDGDDEVNVDDDLLGTASIMTGAGDDTVSGGDLQAIEDAEEVGNQSFGEAVAASINTGAGSDTVTVNNLQNATDWNNGVSLLDQSDDSYYIKGASIETEDGIDTVNFDSAAEGTLIDTGADGDIVNVVIDGTTVLAADDTDDVTGNNGIELGLDEEVDELGAVVRLGSGDDEINFTDVNSNNEDDTVTTTLIDTDALLDGGEGADVLNVTALDEVTVVAIAQGEEGDANGADSFNAYVTGIETANLTIANQVEAGTETALATNDDSDTDGLIQIDVLRFDADLETINLRSEEAAVETDVANENWEAGTATEFVVNNLREGVALNLSANEATGVDADTQQLAHDSTIDVTLTVDLADASGDADLFTLDLEDGNAGYTGDEDLDISLTMAETASFPDGKTADTDYMVENVVINLGAGGSHFIDMNGFGDADFANSDDNLGTFMQWRNENPLTNQLLADYTAEADKAAFGQGFAVETSFTLNDTAAGEEIHVVDVTADDISILGASDVVLEIGEFSNNYTIVTGSGDDTIDMTQDLVDDEDAIDGGDGANTLVIHGDNSMGFSDDVQTENDEVWINKSNIQTLEIVSDDSANTVVLDEEAFVTGIETINITGDQDQQTTIILGEDFLRGLELTTTAAQGFTLIDLTSNQDTVDTDLSVALFADDAASFTLEDQYERVTTDLTITLNDAAGQTWIDSTNGADADGEVAVVVTAGSINSLTLLDSAGDDNGAITVTVDDNWSASTLTVDASDVANDDADNNLDVDENPGDYALSIATGGMTFNGSAEMDAILVVTGTANSDDITGGLLGDTINGGAGDDEINGDNAVTLAAQVDTVTFAANYNAGDVVTVTVDGNIRSATLAAAASGTLVAAAFADYLVDGADSLADNITMAGGSVAVLGTATSALGVLTLTGGVDGDEYVVASATNDVASNATAQVQTLTIGSIASDTAENLTVVWNGTSYTATITDVAGVETVAAVAFDAAVANLAIAGNVITITGPADGAAFPLITQVTNGATATGSLAYTAGVANTNTDEANPTVTSVTAAITAIGGDDTINGGADNDTINGNVGDDTIAGGTGDDTITGGAGSDALNGDAGHDVFVYDAVSESTGLVTDTITGFTGGTLDANNAGTADDFTTGDVIDLSGIAADLGFTGVSFIGTFADDTVADTQLVSGATTLQVVYVSGDNALYADIDASGDINDGDMVISLVGVTGTLTQANFNPLAVA